MNVNLNDSRVSKVIKFEGAGWSSADSSKATDMQNCRVRTTFINDHGRKIYLEMGCYDNRKKTSYSKWHLGYDIPWHINHLFYTKDRKEYGACSPDFSNQFHSVREFTKKNVLWLLNEVCQASFSDIETINWISDRDQQEWDGFSHTGLKVNDFHLEDK